MRHSLSLIYMYQLNAHMFRKMKLAPSPTCSCGLVDQTAEHILQRFPLLQTTRTYVWPAAVQLHTKLWQQEGTGEDRHIHLADWTLSAAAIEKKKKKKKKKKLLDRQFYGRYPRK